MELVSSGGRVKGGTRGKIKNGSFYKRGRKPIGEGVRRRGITFLGRKKNQAEKH